MHDLRYALRILLRNPAFAAAAVLTLALGIGVNSAIFTVINTVLLKPLPYRDPGRLVMIWETMKANPNQFPDPSAVKRIQHWPATSDQVKRWRELNHSFEAIAGYAPGQFSISGQGEPERMRGMLVTQDFFRMLGAQPALGRVFRPEEMQPGDDRVIVLSYGFWQERFGGNPGALGATVGVDGYPHTVIGVMPASFRIALPQAEPEAGFWLPTSRDNMPRRRFVIVTAAGRLRPGVRIEQAQAEMSAIAVQISGESPLNRDRGIHLAPMAEEMQGDVRPALLVLLGAAGCVLLIACANIANLLLARSAARQREMGIRAVLGVSRGRLMRQVLTESVAPALAGGALGVLFAHWGVKALVAATPKNLLPRAAEIGIDGRVLLFGLALSVATGVLFGLAPAWQAARRAARGELGEALKESGRTTTGGRGIVLGKALVVIETALALVLLAGAGLLVRSFVRLTGVEVGFRTNRILTVGVTLPDSKYREDPAKVEFAQRWLERVRALPGVEDAAVTNSIPVLPHMSWGFSFAMEGPNGRQEAAATLRSVTPDYFRVFGLRIRKGRLFTAADSAAEPMLVNEAFVRRYWPNAPANSTEPLGRHVYFHDKPHEIVGVLADDKQGGQARETTGELYTMFQTVPAGSMALVARTAGEPMAMVPAIRDAVRGIDRDQPLQDIQTMDDVMYKSVATPRFRMLLLSVFAGLALVLAAVGIYGVISYGVAQRTHEIGIRMAVGAERGDVLRMVIGQALALAAAGVALGLAGAAAATRVLASVLFGTRPMDALTLAAVSLGLLAVATAAGYIPARRATRVDPMTALRWE
jgi:putative ABC transport system permease protein